MCGLPQYRNPLVNAEINMLDLLKELIKYAGDSINKIAPASFRAAVKPLALLLSLILINGIFHYVILNDPKVSHVLTNVIQSKSFIITNILLIALLLVLFTTKALYRRRKLKLFSVTLILLITITSSALVYYNGVTQKRAVSLYPINGINFNPVVLKHLITILNQKQKLIEFRLFTYDEGENIQCHKIKLTEGEDFTAYSKLKKEIRILEDSAFYLYKTSRFTLEEDKRSNLEKLSKELESTASKKAHVAEELEKKLVIREFSLKKGYYEFLREQRGKSDREVKIALTSDRLEGNIFSETRIKERLAIISTIDLDNNILNPINDSLLVYKYVILKSMTSLMIADCNVRYHTGGEFRGCVFDQKIEKREIVNNILLPSICEDHVKQINNSYHQDIANTASEIMSFQWIDNRVKSEISSLEKVQ